MYLKRELYYPLFKKKFKTGIFFAMKGYRQVSLLEILFQLRGCGHPQNDATPNFFPDSKRSI